MIDPMEQSQREPQRLSHLYQYHNAPEVAPAHGLEYDDTIHSASSDKYPVVHSRHHNSTHNGKVFDNDRPPRIIFGMKVRTFLLVALAMVLIVVGAAVGGAVGGKSMRENHAQEGAWPAEANGGSTTVDASSSPSSNTPESSSTYSAPAPTYTPITSCPQANNTIYTSSFANGRSGSTSNSANLSFVQYCDLESPLESLSVASTLLEAFVYSLRDCVEACAALNYWAGNRNCSVAVYDAGGSRPRNCRVGHAEDIKVRDLEEKDGMAIAVLRD